LRWGKYAHAGNKAKERRNGGREIDRERRRGRDRRKEK